MTKPAQKTDTEAFTSVEAFPSRSIDAYVMAADEIESDLWNRIIDHIDEDFPIDWMAGILEKLKIELMYLEDE